MYAHCVPRHNGQGALVRYAPLKGIKQPVLIINGSNDIIIRTINSFILQQSLPNAWLIVYPEANHGS